MHIYTCYPDGKSKKKNEPFSFLKAFRKNRGAIKSFSLGIGAVFVSIGNIQASQASQTVAPRVVPSDMVLVKGGNLSAPSQDGRTNVGDLLVGIHEVTNRQWNEIVNWGRGLRDDGVQIRPPLANFVQLSHRPMELDSIDLDRPANGMLNEDEIFMWCNLKSIKEGLKPVYYKVQYNTTTKAFPPTIGSYYGFMNSTDIEPTSTGNMGPYMDPTANGYRVPLSSEWDWIDNLGKKKPYYKYSGTDDFSTISTIPSSSGSYFYSLPAFINESNKKPNQLGIYDLYGSVAELCFDIFSEGPSKKWPWSTNYYNESVYGEYGSFGRNGDFEFAQRIRKGGGFLYRSLSEFDRPTYSYGPERYDSVRRAFVRHDAGISGRDYNTWGFRLVRNADPYITWSKPKLPSIPLEQKQDSKIGGRLKMQYYPGSTHTNNNYFSIEIPSNIKDLDDIVWAGFGGTYMAVKRKDGTIHIWSLAATVPAPYFEQPPQEPTVLGFGHTWYGQYYLLAAEADGSLEATEMPFGGGGYNYGLIPEELTLPNPNREIIKIHSTRNYTIILLEDGTVEGWGLNPLDDITDAMLHNATTRTHFLNQQWAGLPFKTNRPLTSPKVVDISGGPHHIALLLENGGVELHASNAQVAQLLGAYSSSEYLNRNYPMGSPTNKVVALKSTEYTTIALYEDNTLEVAGELQLSGVPPQSIDGEIVSIDAFLTTSQVLLKDGTIIGWKEGWEAETKQELILQVSLAVGTTTATGVNTPFIITLVADKEEVRRISEIAEEGFSKVKSYPNNYGLWSDNDVSSLSVQRYNDGFYYGTRAVLNNPAAYNLYTTNSIQNLKMGGLLLQKGGTGSAQLRLKLKESSDLVNWTTKEELLWDVSLPGNKSFLRIVQDEE